MTSWWLVLIMSTWALNVHVSGNMENKLIKDLLTMSEKNARPLKNSSDILKINFELSFNSITIDEQAHTLTNIGYETVMWQDQILVWDPELYAGIHQVFFDHKFIWTPDIALFNSVGDVDVQYGQGNVVVDSQGRVTFVRTSKSKVNCAFNYLRFPFDTLNCTMVFGSWVYSSEKIDLSLMSKTVDLSMFQANPAWTLAGAKAVRQAKVYSCCPELYYSIEYEIEFHRNSSHYVNVLLFPGFLLSILTILLFLLPTQSSERITLGVLLFCAFFILLVYTSSLVTEWHRLPYFVIFLIFNLVVITLFTFLNSFIIRLSITKRGQEVPKILRTLMFEVIARIFCMKSIVQRNRSGHLVAPEFQFQEQQGNYNKLTVTSEKQPLETAPKEDLVDDLPDVGSGSNGQRSLEVDVAFIRALTMRYGQKMKDSAREEKFSREWKDLAEVFNRLFLVIYNTVILIAIGAAFIQISGE